MFPNRIRAYFERRGCPVKLTVAVPSVAPAQTPTTCQARHPQTTGGDLPHDRQHKPQDAPSRPRDDAWMNFSI
jgi:hypothetical protein